MIGHHALQGKRDHCHSAHCDVLIGHHALQGERGHCHCEQYCPNALKL